MTEPEINPVMPKGVRDALAKQAALGPHPDADLLTAYAERGLLARESATIAGHLATCADCRAVVFLANSAEDETASETEPTFVPTKRTSWLRWAMPVTAALALAMSVLVVRQSSFRNPETAADKQSASALPAKDAARHQMAPAETTNLESKKAPMVARAADDKVATKPLPSAKEADTRAKAEGSNGKTATMAKATSAGGVMEERAQAGALRAGVAQPQPKVLAAAAPAISTPMLQVADAAAEPSPASPANISNAVNMTNGPGGPSQRIQAQSQANYSNAQYATRGTQALAVEVPDSYVASGAVAEQKAAPMRLDALQKQKSSLFSAPMRWRVSAQGYLERLVGDAWRPAMTSARKSFRTVAVMGSHVWAGGSGPEIVHSTDDGNSWATIRVGTEKEPLTGTVKTIHADDPWHLAVVTDTGNTWLTSDGGVTWNKQQ